MQQVTDSPNMGSDAESENLELEDDLDYTLSKELLKREKEYIRRNKEIQAKSEQVVKKAELLVKEGKQQLEKPIACFLNPTQLDNNDLDEDPNDNNTVPAISRAAEYAPILSKPVPPKRPKSILKSTSKKPAQIQNQNLSQQKQPHVSDRSATPQTKPVDQPRSSSTRPKSAMSAPRYQNDSGNANVSDSIPEHLKPALGPIDEGIGLEATNRLLKAKLVVVQEEMEKIVKNQGIKVFAFEVDTVIDTYDRKQDSAIAMLEEKLKFFDEERSKISKKMQTLQAQIEKVTKANVELKAKNETLEAERGSLKKELDAVSKSQKTVESDVNSKDLRLNRALEEVDKLKQALGKTNSDSKDKMETLKKNQHDLLNENKKLVKQKAELLGIFKKQNLLIDNLKRQKLHLEAAALLDFSEEEFVRALNCRPMAGRDV
ncbi:Golgin sub A member 2 [Chytriomyces hyalinus]|nr:Golgin sub A member 2 [Chytriomyces hyalinus]